MARQEEVIWVEWKEKCFCMRDWTTQIRLNWLNKIELSVQAPFSFLLGKNPFRPTKRKSLTTKQEFPELFKALRD
jgi:hypothetical protein